MMVWFPISFMLTCTIAIGSCKSASSTNADFVYMYETDESCTFSGNQTRGVCMSAEMCPGAIVDWRERNVKPTSCGFVGNTPKVCCKLIEVTTQQSITPLQMIPAATAAAAAEQQRISAEKCLTHRSYRATQNENGFDTRGATTAGVYLSHMAAIGWSGNDEINWRCSGALISEQFVLTAAHCVSSDPITPDIVQIGQNSLSNGIYLDKDAQKSSYSINKIVVHPLYQAHESYNDIALIRMTVPILLGGGFQPACLWQSEDLMLHNEDELVMAAAYGQTRNSRYSSKELLIFNLTVVDNAECEQIHPPDRKSPNGVLDGQLCAGDTENIYNVCRESDSSGPIQIYRDDGQFHIIGIASVARLCDTNSLDIFTRVSSYLDWIESVVWPKERRVEE